MRAVEQLPVYAAELRRLSGSLPIVIRQRGAHAEAVALLHDRWLDQPVFNDAGHWCAGAVPQCLIVHPFNIVVDADSGDRAVGVARDRNCVHALAKHAFFTDAKLPTARLQRVIRRLEILDSGAVALQAAVDLIVRLGVLLDVPLSGQPHGASPSSVWVLDDSKLIDVDPAQLAATHTAAFWRLAGAMSASRRLLAPALRVQPMLDAWAAPSVTQLFSLSQQESHADTSSTVAEPADHPFLVDDAQVLRFRVNATRSVFRSG
jgi:hypothetical protein